MRSLAVLLAACVSSTLAYSLVDDYMENNYTDFFDKFSFWTKGDTTGGFVDYVSENDAWNKGLIGNGGNIYLGVDSKTSNPSNGRASVRLTGTKSYNVGTLFVADITHMPGVCGTWPAFWTTSSTGTWPQEGEIDIIEGANSATNNQMTFHSSSVQGSCQVSSTAAMTATRDRWGDCNQEDNGGCDAIDHRSSSFGTGFNSGDGGVYAMEWTKSWVRVWFFPRNSIPSGSSGPLGANPIPSQWGMPTTSFEGGCDFNAHVKTQSIIINTDFCGTWAAGTWSSSGCAKSTGVSDCQTYVANNPSAFKDAFWTFYQLKVYQ